MIFPIILIIITIIWFYGVLWLASRFWYYYYSIRILIVTENLIFIALRQTYVIH